MRFVIAFFLIAHGMAHLVGFWCHRQLAKPRDFSYKTTIASGAIDVGDIGIRLVGIFWLLTAAAFVIAGRAPRSMPNGGRRLLSARR